MARLISAAEVTVTSFVVGFLGAWLVTQSFDLAALKVAAIAGAAGAAKAALSFLVGDPNSAMITAPAPAGHMTFDELRAFVAQHNDTPGSTPAP